MPLNAGELSAFLGLDDSTFSSKLDANKHKLEAVDRKKTTARIDVDTSAAQSKLGSLSSMISQHSSSLSSAGQKMSLGVTLPLLAGDVIALKLAGDLEQSKIAFETLLGSKSKADAFVASLQQFAAKTPFQFTDLQMQAKRMLAYGFAAEEVLPMLTNIGDATAALGDPQALETITRSMGQMNAKGKVQAEEMMQINEAGISGWKFLAEGMGMSIAQVQEEVTAGNVTAAQGIDALMKGMADNYGGLMAKQSKTMLGQFSNTVDELKMTAAKFGAAIAPIVKPGLAAFTSVLSVVSSLPKPLLTVIGVFGGIASAIGPALWALGGVAEGFKVIRSAWGVVHTGKIIAETTAVGAETTAIGVQTAAIEANTIAKAENALAGGGSVAGIGRGALPLGAAGAAGAGGLASGAGLILPGVALVAATVATGFLAEYARRGDVSQNLKNMNAAGIRSQGRMAGSVAYSASGAAANQAAMAPINKAWEEFAVIAQKIKDAKPGAGDVGELDRYKDELTKLEKKYPVVAEQSDKLKASLDKSAGAFDAAAQAATDAAEAIRTQFGSMADFMTGTMKAAIMGTPLPTAAQAAFASQSDQAAASAAGTAEQRLQMYNANRRRLGLSTISGHAEGYIKPKTKASSKETTDATAGQGRAAPAARAAIASGDTHLHFNGPVVGGKAGMRELADMVAKQVMQGVRRGLVGQNA